MDHEIDHLRQAIGRSKIALFAIIGFLVLLTYLLITISQQIATIDSVSTQSQANEGEYGFGMRAARALMQRYLAGKGSEAPQTIVDTSTPTDGNQTDSSTSCMAKGTIGGADRAFGRKLDCSINCGTNAAPKVVQKGDGWTQEECQAEANRVCGCSAGQTTPTLTPPAGSCRSTWRDIDSSVSCNRFGGSCYRYVEITCESSGNKYVIHDEACRGSDSWDRDADQICCKQDSNLACREFLGKALCDPWCKEQKGKDCVEKSGNPGYYTCEGNDPSICTP